MTLPRLVAGVAAVQVGMALAVLLVRTGPAGGPTLPLFAVGVIVAYSVGAALLLVAGREDERAADLGAAFAAVASTFAVTPAGTALWTESDPSARAALYLLSVRVDAMIPFLLWRFAGAFPRVESRDPYVRVVRAASGATLVVGVALVVVNVVAVAARPDVLLPRLVRFEGGSVYWLLVLGSSLPALLLMPLRQRLADRPEQRRVRLLLFGAALGATPIIVFSILDALGLMEDPTLFQVTRWIALPALISVPFATAYAVLVDRALDVRLLVRAAMRYALARYTLLAGASLPLVGVGLFVFLNREMSIGELFTGTESLVLILLSIAAAIALRGRERLEVALDRRFFREQYDARRILRSLVDEAHEADSVWALSRLLERQLDRALHPTAVAVLRSASDDGWLVPDSGGVRPLPPAGTLLSTLARTGSVTDVSSARVAASRDEVAWIRQNGVQLLAPLRGKAHSLLGVVALGEKRSELPYTPEDRELIAAVASAASISFENLSMHDDRAARARSREGSAEPVPAWQCVVCGAVQASESGGCRVCGAALAPAAVPAVIGGKFGVVRRLGSGGGGTVYLAVDEPLGRRVAVKALHVGSAHSPILLQREARALAAVSHPNLAVVFTTEEWRGRTLMILEYLPGGSLATLLERGPLAVDRTLRLGREIGEALAYIHRHGLLHRDVKPSNVGFTEDGDAKLLDFGLARMIEVATSAAADGAGGAIDQGWSTRSGPLPGTLPYSSPEVLLGKAPSPRDDLWGLSLTLYESLTGLNPYRGRTPAGTMARILAGRSSWPTAGKDAGAEVEALLRECLDPDPGRRPESAEAMLSLLGGIRRP